MHCANVIEKNKNIEDNWTTKMSYSPFLTPNNRYCETQLFTRVEDNTEEKEIAVGKKDTINVTSNVPNFGHVCLTLATLKIAC